MDAVAERTPCPGAGTAHFHYRNGELHCEAAALAPLAERYGTPLYVYSSAAMRERYAAVRAAFGEPARICYAVKANGNRAILRLFDSLGAGFDLVSGGELLRLQAAGIDATRAVFAGVAKEPWEIEAGVRAAVAAFHVESAHELPLLAAAGRAAGVRVPVSLRLNPELELDTHAYIATARADSKFGVTLDQAAAVVARIAQEPQLRLCGYHVHLGSQLRTVEPWLQAFDRVAAFLDAAPGHAAGAQHYDLGGGFGIAYGRGREFDVAALAAALLPRLRARGLVPVVEPGRFLVGDAGVLLATVLGEKRAGRTRFLLVDAAMNDLLRPALYGAEHPVAPLQQHGGGLAPVDLVGPVCESGDFLARGCMLPELRAGDRLAVLGAGAYGAAMASNYNSRRRPAEVMVAGGAAQLIRRREAWSRLWEDEVDPT